MSTTSPRVVPVPSDSRVTNAYVSPNLADAYAIDLPAGTVRDPQRLATFLFEHQPRWIEVLMRVRDAVVSVVGLKTGKSLRSANAERPRIGMFKVYETNALEVIMGEEDKHLDFRASVLYRAAGGATTAPHLIFSTVVECHNLLGRTYLTIISPFHRLVVQGFLRRAARVGWPREEA